MWACNRAWLVGLAAREGVRRRRESVIGAASVVGGAQSSFGGRALCLDPLRSRNLDADQGIVGRNHPRGPIAASRARLRRDAPAPREEP